MRKSIAAVVGGLLSAGSFMGMGSGAAEAAPALCNEHQWTVTSIQTKGSYAAICKWQGDGRLEYHGYAKSNHTTVQAPVVSVTKLANHPGYGYTAKNNGYTYMIHEGLRLVIVDPSGAVIDMSPAI
ncbi:hypothetical protein [Tsukamurella tyrosinosolvens]|uniref:hypothetical protein n=1 Tax=Tsukamurella tyrosinosolvens TaxID=57704 RepID=UPI000CA2DD37|nr:hypothetical protein [Tsukamurella tyrosinosolvens]AUN41837.1 hypothetical protein ASU32_19015 [Tsukamurella tyrosinosolvens]